MMFSLFGRSLIAVLVIAISIGAVMPLLVEPLFAESLLVESEGDSPPAGTITPSPTPTESSPLGSTPTLQPTQTQAATSTPTAASSATATATTTLTLTPTATAAPSTTAASTSTVAATATVLPTATATATATSGATATATPSPTPTISMRLLAGAVPLSGGTAPTISFIGSRVVARGTSTGAIPFTVGDDGALDGLALTASSSNTALVPDGNIVLGGSGESRTVEVTPAAGKVGTATITVTASDGTSSTSVRFVVAVSEPANGWGWGANASGQVGNEPLYDKYAPVRSLGLSNAVAVAGGASHSLALKGDGTVWAYGANSYGQLGDGTTVRKTIAVKVNDLSDVVAIEAGYNHSLALKGDGSVWAWGANGYGQLGDGTTEQRNTPVQVVMDSDGDGNPDGFLSDVVAIEAGYNHSLALKDDGTVWAWGANHKGQLGNEPYDDAPHATATQVSVLSAVVAVAGGGYHSLALKDDGTVWCWGENSWGQLGNGSSDSDPHSTPTQVVGLSAVVAVAGGGYHSLALKSDGTLRAWGRNDNCQLGINYRDSAPHSTPVSVWNLTTMVAVAGGDAHSLALKDDGTVWSWGDNANGQMGNVTTGDHAAAAQARNVSGVVALSAGTYHSLAVVPNRAPSAASDSYSTNEDTPLSKSAPGVLSNDQDPDSDPLTAILVTDPTHGTLALDASGAFTYTPNPDYYGSDSFSYKVNDGILESDAVVVSITVNSANEAPSFTKGADQTVSEDAGAQTVTGWATNISAGPADEASQTVEFILTTDNDALFSSLPAIASDGTLTYTPAANANGSATVTVRIRDDGGTVNGGQDESASQTFLINVIPVNDAPSFVKGADQTVSEDAGAQTVTGWATNISAGPEDEASQTVEFILTTDNDALFSSLPAITPDGTLTYTPAANANGSATVTVRIRDDGGTVNGGQDESAPQTFQITVTPVNDAPTLSGGPYILAGTDEDTTSIGTLVSTILAGLTASDIEGDTLGIAVIASSGNGTWQYSIDGTNWSGFGTVAAHSALLLSATTKLRYIPDGANGETASITFRAWDGTIGSPSSGISAFVEDATTNGGTTAFSSGTAQATITVTDVNDAPILWGGPYILASTDEDTTSIETLVSAILAGLTAFDVDGDTLGIAVIASGGNGTWQYSTDGTNWSDLGIVAAHSALLLSATTQLHYVPDGANGETASITFRAWDGTIGSPSSGISASVEDANINGGTTAFSTGTAQATITVNPVNDAPVVTAPSALSVEQDANLAITGMSVSDIDAGSSPVEVTLSALHGTLSLLDRTGLTFTLGDGVADASMAFTGTLDDVNAALSGIVYRGNPGYSGLDTVTLSIDDQGNSGAGGPQTDSKTILITVKAPPDDDSGWRPAPTPVPTQPTATPNPVVPTATPSPTPMLVVVTPAPTAPVTVVGADVPAGVPTPTADGVVALIGGDSRGTGVIDATPTAWGGASVEIRVDNEGGNRVVSFQPLPEPTVQASIPVGYRVIRTFSLEVYNYDPASNSATQRTEDEKREAEPVVLKLSVSREELDRLGLDEDGRPDVSRFALMRVRSDGSLDPVPSQYVSNDGPKPPEGWFVACFVPRSSYLLVVLPEGERVTYGELRPDQIARLEVAYTDGGRYFPETGYAVHNDSFWDYFRKRGGIRVFGFPVSDEFTLDGFTVQLFQRAAMQQQPGGGIALINLLDGGSYELKDLDAYFPVADPEMVESAPSPRDVDFGERAMEFVDAHVPDEWEGSAVGFRTAYEGMVRYEDAYPDGEGDASLLPLFNLEVWGLPTSMPVRDPRNHNFVYQRFQRGIMHYDAASGLAQGILLGDELKRLLIAEGYLVE